MVLPDVAPVSGRSDAEAVASLGDPMAPVVAPAPSVVAEWAVSSMAGAEPLARGPVSLVGVDATAPSQVQPDVAMVVFEGAAQSAPPVAQAMVPDMG